MGKMNKKIKFISVPAIGLVIFLLLTVYRNGDLSKSDFTLNEPMNNTTGESENIETESNPESVQNSLEIWNSVKQMPDDPDVINNWYTIGPSGFNVGGVTHTGRVYDIKSYGSFLRAATVGGLFQSALIFWIAKTDKEVESMFINTFDSKPGDDNFIVIGAGDRGGNSAGIWYTSNAGTNWTRVAPATNFGTCRTIRFASPTKVYAGTTTGFFVSTNSGLNWTNYYNGGDVMNFCFRNDNNNVIVLGVRNIGVLRSTAATPSFSLVSSGLPISNIGSVGVTSYPGNPSIMFASICINGDILNVVKRSNDGGATWNTDISPPLSLRQNFPDFGTNVIQVSPSNSNVLLLGSVPLFRSSNGGTNWYEVNDPDIHVDYHRIEFSGANTVYACNHGGMQYSDDGGANWSSATNYLPTAIFYDFDAGKTAHNIFMGGLFDNGIVRTTNRGVSWEQVIGGTDGISAGMKQDASCNTVVVSHSGCGGCTLFRKRTVNGGSSWSVSETGLDLPHYSENFREFIKFANNQFFTFKSGSGFNDGKMFRSVNDGQTWSQWGSTLSSRIFTFALSNNGDVYLATVSTGAQRLYVIQAGTGSTFDRTSNLPAGRSVYSIFVHPNNNQVAYISLTPGSGNEIYKTTDAGVTWNSIQGNLPNDLPIGAILSHPVNNNIVYAGTGGSLFNSYNGYGVFRTTNNGVSWHRWNNGMPNAAYVTGLRGIDSISINGKFYVATSTFGRGIWIRESSGDDPTPVNNQQVPVNFKLAQNFPNPFNPMTTIKYSLPKESHVKLYVYDINGKTVSILVNQKQQAGNYDITFSGNEIASGVFFYRLETEEYSEVRKMMLIK